MSETSLRITCLGHATVLLERDGVRVLTDPVLRPRAAHLHRVDPLGPAEGGGLAGVHAVPVGRRNPGPNVTSGVLGE
jgi:L-ascorbate metabolism protein UlaG (beta-lactamase superfamily)